MITLSDSQFAELQKYCDAIQSIINRVSNPETETTILPPKPAKARIVRPKRSSYFLETPAFIYRYNALPDAQRRLCLLYRFLIREYREACTWIDADTPLEDFCALFSGERTDKVIIWTEAKQNLYYFVKRMSERQIIHLPKGWYIWQIAENHFADRRGKPYPNLRNQHLPQNAGTAIERLIDILDPTLTSAADLDEMSRRLGASLGAS